MKLYCKYYDKTKWDKNCNKHLFHKKCDFEQCEDFQYSQEGLEEHVKLLFEKQIHEQLKLHLNKFHFNKTCMDCYYYNNLICTYGKDLSFGIDKHSPICNNFKSDCGLLCYECIHKPVCENIHQIDYSCPNFKQDTKENNWDYHGL